jgi:hypothetical protein
VSIWQASGQVLSSDGETFHRTVEGIGAAGAVEAKATAEGAADEELGSG